MRMTTRRRPARPRRRQDCRGAAEGASHPWCKRAPGGLLRADLSGLGLDYLYLDGANFKMDEHARAEPNRCSSPGGSTGAPETRSFCAEGAFEERRSVVVFSPVRYRRDKIRHMKLCERIEDGLIAIERRVSSPTRPRSVLSPTESFGPRPSGDASKSPSRRASSRGTSTRKLVATTRSCCAGAMSSRLRSAKKRPRLLRCCATTGTCRQSSIGSPRCSFRLCKPFRTCLPCSARHPRPKAASRRNLTESLDS